MIKYLEKTGEINFDKIFNQRLGYLLFKDFCLNVVNEQVISATRNLLIRYVRNLMNVLILINYQVPQFKFYEEIKKFEKIDSNDDRRKKAREIYDTFIMRELLSNSGGENVLNIYFIKTNHLPFSGLYSKESAEHVQQLLQKNEVPPNLFELYVEEIFSYLRGNIFKRFIESDKFTRNDLFQFSWPTGPEGKHKHFYCNSAIELRLKYINTQVLSMEEFGAQYKPQHERLLCPPHHRAGRVRRGVRVQEGGHGEDVRHEGEGERAGWADVL